MSGKKSKRKGYKFENEIVHDFKDNGIDAHRVPLSGATEYAKGDVYIPCLGATIECKRRKSINNMFYDVLKESNIGAVRADKKRMFFFMDGKYFYSLIRTLMYLREKLSEVEQNESK